MLLLCIHVHFSNGGCFEKNESLGFKWGGAILILPLDLLVSCSKIDKLSLIKYCYFLSTVPVIPADFPKTCQFPFALLTYL